MKTSPFINQKLKEMNYSNAVLIGNWSEERLKNEYDLKMFLRKRDRKELVVQKSRILFSNLLMERPLKISGSYVLYGYNVQVIACDMPGKIIDGKTKYGLALSSLVTGREVDYKQNISDGCSMTLSPLTTPCCRNTFRIIKAFEDEEKFYGTKVKYGDEFILRAENYANPDAEHLYVRVVRLGGAAPADRLPLRLSSTRDPSCRWVAVPCQASKRLEALGNSIKTDDKVLLKNSCVDMNLSVINHKMPTFFGQEYDVSCRNCVDLHKRPTAENVFLLKSDVDTKKRE